MNTAHLHKKESKEKKFAFHAWYTVFNKAIFFIYYLPSFLDVLLPIRFLVGMLDKEKGDCNYALTESCEEKHDESSAKAFLAVKGKLITANTATKLFKGFLVQIHVTQFVRDYHIVHGR